MATIKITLAQQTKSDGTAAVTLCVCHKSCNAHIATGVFLPKEKVKYKGDEIFVTSDVRNGKALCNTINSKLALAKSSLIDIKNSRELSIASMNAKELRDEIVYRINPLEADAIKESRMKKSLFEYRFIEYMENEDIKSGTRSNYANTLSRLRDFDPRLSKRKFEDIDVEYLKSFEKFLRGTSSSANGRSCKFRNIRTIFNKAIDDGVTTYYPFGKRKFKIAQEETKSRAIELDVIRKLLTCKKNPIQQKWADLFFIVFGLVGINFPDLCSIKDIDEDGYVSYVRAKTNKPYRVKVEPEIKAIIDRHRGSDHLLDYFDKSRDFNGVARRMSKSLKQLGIVAGITAYYARHSWGCIAFNDAGVSMDVISYSLGHSSDYSGAKVTQRYARGQQRLRDEANRMVLDLLYK